MKLETAHLLTDFSSFPPSALTDIRGHLPERGWSVGGDGRRSVIVRLIQVRQAGSQPLAQSVGRVGVASVAGPGQVGYDGTPGRC